MGRNYDALIAQDSTLKQLNSMDLNTLATVNAQVFAELRGSVGSLDKFNQYLYQLNDFVAMSAQLNTQVNELLGRTQQVGAVANKISNNLDFCCYMASITVYDKHKNMDMKIDSEIRPPSRHNHI